MKRNSFLTIGVFACAIFLLGGQGDIMAQSDYVSTLLEANDQNPERDFIVEKELDCLENFKGDIQELGWDDVCYTSEKSDRGFPEYGKSEFGQGVNRRHAVSKELDEWQMVEKRHEEYGKGKTWADVEEKDFEFERNDAPQWLEFSDKNEKKIKPRLKTKESQTTVGWQVFGAKYVEPNVMKQKGTLQGPYGEYVYRVNSSDDTVLGALNTYKLEGMFAWGEFDYESQGQTGLRTKSDDYMFELRGLIGREEQIKGNNLLIYSGFGYRYLNDDDDGNLTIVGNVGYYGYERESNYYYIPVGFEVFAPLKDKWSVTFKGEYDFFIHGKQVSHLSDGNKFLTAGSYNDDVTNAQDSGYGMRGSIKIAKEYENVNFIFEPFWRYWNIENSEVKGTMIQGVLTDGLEPENTTVEGGVKFGVEF